MDAQKNSAESSGSPPEKTFDLIQRAVREREVTVRDDLYDFSVILDAVRLCRKRGGRFRLIDSGRFDFYHLEWLGEAGMDFYTGSDRRADVVELDFINLACGRGGGRVFYFFRDSLEKDETEEKKEGVNLSELAEIKGMGVSVYLSNREKTVDLSLLKDLAESGKKGGGKLVTYHHGKWDAALLGLAGQGVWVHLSDEAAGQEEEKETLIDGVLSAGKAAKRLIFHIETPSDPIVLEKLLEAGAYLIFKNTLFDYRSPYRPLVRLAERRKPGYGAFYLYDALMP